MKNPQGVLNDIGSNILNACDVKIVAYPDHNKRGYVNMEKIIATSQGKGNGTRALTKFKQMCKSEGFKGISISVLPLSGFKTTTAEDVDRLVGWYLKNGFKITRTSPVIQMELKL